MPTGYTARVSSGDITEFRDFALLCARAFGATVTMRDAPLDEPIPDAFAPSTYHAERRAEAEMQLSAVSVMSPDECEQRAYDEYEKAMQSHLVHKTEMEDVRARYQRMLEKVMAWNPPSADHRKFADFMKEQLETSINFDCYSLTEYIPKRCDGETWKRQRIDQLTRDIKHHTDEQDKENERIKMRNLWIRLLRESLTDSGVAAVHVTA